MHRGDVTIVEQRPNEWAVWFIPAGQLSGRHVTIATDGRTMAFPFGEACTQASRVAGNDHTFCVRPLETDPFWLEVVR